MKTLVTTRQTEGFALIEVRNPRSPWHGPAGDCAETDTRIGEWLSAVADIAAWINPGEGVSYGSRTEPFIGPIPVALAEIVAPALQALIDAHAQNGCPACVPNAATIRQAETLEGWNK